MSAEDVTLAVVVVTALFFDFTNGFHDTANSIATSVSTHALSPRIAVISSAILNFIGAFFFFAVAATIATGIVNPEAITLKVVLAGLVGAITWNLITWYLGLPSSSSHALIGGIIGSSVAATGGFAVVNWTGLKDKVLVPSLLAPVAGFVLAAALMTALIWIVRKRAPSPVNRVFRRLQLVSGGFVAFTHGTNDAQKTMGVITLALIVSGHQSADHFSVPLWVKVSRRDRDGARHVRRRLADHPHPRAAGGEARAAARVLRTDRDRAPSLADCAPRSQLVVGHGGRRTPAVARSRVEGVHTPRGRAPARHDRRRDQRTGRHRSAARAAATSSPTSHGPTPSRSSARCSARPARTGNSSRAWADDIFKAFSFTVDRRRTSPIVMRAWGELDAYVDDMVAHGGTP